MKRRTLEEIYQEIELEILLDMAEEIGIEDIDIEEWYQSRIDKKPVNKRVFERRDDELIAEITGLILSSSKSQEKKTRDELKPLIDAGLIEQSNIETSTNVDDIQDVTEEIQKEALQRFQDINSSVLRLAGKEYEDIVNRIATEVLNGDKALNQASVDAIKELAQKGLTSLITKDGRELSLEGHLPTVIRATQKAAAIATQEAMYDDYDIDLVEISSHKDSRPTHAPFQGRIYSRRGISEDYPPLSVTGYGAVDGLITGINCRHQMYPYIDGSPSTYKPYDLTETSKNYKESQEQRRLERNIRKAKKELALLQKAGADKETLASAKSKVRDKQEKLRAFIKVTGRARRSQRERTVE